ncbi:MAG: ABC transporter ATP-binding protein [Halanaerobiales bacterium]
MRGGFGSRIMDDKNEDIKISQVNREAVKLLLKYLRRNTKSILLAVLAMIIVTLTTLAGPYLTKVAIDEYILKGNLAGLNIIFILMLLSYSVFWLSSYWQTYLSSMAGHKIVASIREDLYNHLLKLPIDFYRRNPTGDIMSRLTHDVNALSDLVSSGFIHFFNDLLTLIGIMLIMLYLDVKLALISFIMVPFIFFAILLLGKRMRNAYRGVRERLAALNADVEENLSGIRLVQALNREAINNGKFKKLSWENLKANLKAVSYFALLFPTMNLSRVLGEALVLTFGGWGVVNGLISLGVLLAFLGYIRRFFAPLADLSQVYNTYQAAAAALDRIYEYLSIKPEISDTGVQDVIKDKLGSDDLQDTKKIKGEILFDKVSFAYEKENVLTDFSLKVKAGEILALVGSTGAGKTTLVNLMTRLYDVKEGSIFIDRIDIRKISFKSLRESISVVPQNVFLFDTSIKENIRYGNPLASDEEVLEAARQVKAHEFIDGLADGYDTEVGEGGVRLSGGQKQLISFARALIADPEILILDEATSSVDAYTEVLIQQALDVLLKDRTAILIAHRFTTLKKVDRIAVLENGSISGLGSHHELMESNDLYRKLFIKQIEVK